MAVGEAWSSTHDVLPYVDGTGIDFCFEFETASDIINAINTGNPAPLASQMSNVVTISYPFLQYGTFLTNHDQVRIFSQLGNSVPKSKLAAGVLLTLPGIPFSGSICSPLPNILTQRSHSQKTPLSNGMTE